MEFEELKTGGVLGKDSIEHSIFEQLTTYSDFYGSLSFSVMNRLTLGTKAILNLDTPVYSSIKGTIDSIIDILRKERINDAYALLRKYFDATVINVYSNIYLLLTRRLSIRIY